MTNLRDLAKSIAAGRLYLAVGKFAYPQWWVMAGTAPADGDAEVTEADLQALAARYIELENTLDSVHNNVRRVLLSRKVETR